jgi:hypothetical protein
MFYCGSSHNGFLKKLNYVYISTYITVNLMGFDLVLRLFSSFLTLVRGDTVGYWGVSLLFVRKLDMANQFGHTA